MQTQIYRQLRERFSHPGISLFRTRELFEVANFLRTYSLAEEKNILDLGCGEGCIGSLVFSKINFGLDIELGSLKKIKNSDVYRNLIAADARNIPIRDEVLDVVFSNSVIEHIAGVERVLKEVSRVLRDGGIFIFTVPSKKFSDYLYLTAILRRAGLSLFGLDKVYSGLRNAQLNHHNILSDSQWQECLSKNFLDIIYKKYYLAPQEIYLWDKICILLRLSKPIGLLHETLNTRFTDAVNKIIFKKIYPGEGGGIFLVARKNKSGVNHNFSNLIYGDVLTDKYAKARFMKIAALIAPYIKQNGDTRLLDIGCYTGDLLTVVPKGVRYFGVDSDSQALKIAEGRGAETLNLDIEKDDIPPKVGQFDIIVASELLEHLKDPARLLLRIQKLIKPSGVILLSLPNECTIYHRLKMLFGKGIDGTAFAPHYHLHFPTIRQSNQFISGYFDIAKKIYWVHLGGGLSEKVLSKISLKFWECLIRLFPSLFARGIIYLLTPRPNGHVEDRCE
jgi:2-polyprenyl-3-methyl-5-hydroxy-6-metoxy-1,4-benzoquinol methylase